MSQKNRLQLTLGVAAGHLILVALGAGGVSLQPLGPLGQLLEAYSVLSGADSGYGFFAPGVNDQLRARFDVIDAEGRETTTSLDKIASREADLRVGDIIGNFAGEEDSPGLQRALAASLAGTIFGRFSEARQVVVRLERYEPVSMAEYRQGIRAQWTPLYRAKFAHPNQQTRGRGDGAIVP